jgi:hypothetical protein
MMGRTVGKIALLAGIGAGAVAVGRRVGRAREAGHDARAGERWLVVTVDLPPDRVTDPLPDPLARLGDRVEVRITPAPGDKGTELAARPRGGLPPQPVRVALRRAKSLLETGEVLRPSEPGSAHPGPAGRVLAAVARRSGGEGRL